MSTFRIAAILAACSVALLVGGMVAPIAISPVVAAGSGLSKGPVFLFTLTPAPTPLQTGTTRRFTLNRAAPLVTAVALSTPTWKRPIGPPAGLAPTPTVTPARINQTAGGLCTNDSLIMGSAHYDLQLRPGQPFNVTGILKNSGTCDWGFGYMFAFRSGEVMAASAPVEVLSARPGRFVTMIENMIAPPAPGHHQGQWQMRAQNGSWFGVTIFVDVDVIPG